MISPPRGLDQLDIMLCIIRKLTLSKHNVVIEGINPDLAHDVKTSMKNASYNNMSLGEDMQATNTCSKRKHNEAKPKDLPTLV